VTGPTRAEQADQFWRLMTPCPPHALYWASLGYRIGILDGKQALINDLERAGRNAARRAIADGTFARPTFAELQARRYGPAGDPGA
jgi:hypothetical protein